MNNPIAKNMFGYKALSIICWVFLAWVFINPVPAAAQLGGSGMTGCLPASGESLGKASESFKSATGMSGNIMVVDQTVAGKVERVACIDQRNGAQRALDQIKTWSMQKVWEELKKSGDIAWRRALQHFLNTLAYDMATYIATGDKGQLPMFETKGWGGYLQDVADNTAGTFIEQLGKNTAIRFNLCNPSLNVMLRINLGLLRSRRPKPPSCTFSQLTKNWETALTQKDFLPKFQDMFNPWSNDLGIALTVQTGMESQVSRTINAAAQDRIEGGGWRPVRSAVEGRIETPADLVGEAARLPIKESTASEKIQTKSIIADSLDIFINTLVGKLITRWLTGGLVTKFPPIGNKLDDLANADSQNQTQGAAGARNRMKSLVEPNFKVRADYDILAELATCPDPNKAGPTDCVIDDRFRQAIERKMTVGQALQEGYLSDTLFGFLATGSDRDNAPEPKFNEGYPYRSMIILRKFRIIPVGWEVAAQKIKDGQADDSTHTLGDLVDCFSTTDDYMGYEKNWCVGLVDPDWVLKAPQNFCKKEGPGTEIISEQVMGEGTGSSLSILRDDTYCADELSVIAERKDGSNVYGYCTEERRKWEFNAKSCEPRDNTCQTFGSADGGAVSYLENTLDFSECNLGNVGCRKYATTGSYANGLVNWNIVNNQPIYLNKQAETCDAESQGCHQFIRLNPGGGANLLINANFEETLTSGDWGGFGDLSDEPYQGSKSLKMTAPKSRNIIIGSNIPAERYNLAGESYTLSFYAKGCAVSDKFWIEDANKFLNLKADTDWARYNLTYIYPTDVTDDTVNFAINSSSCLIDNIKLERGSVATNFSDYAAAGFPSLIYEKLLPSYLMNSCYTDRENGAILDYYKPVVNAPAACADFVRVCKKEEAGCELYTSVANETEIPAKVAADDYCPAACVGYNTFIQSQTIFDSPREAYFIPKTAKTCSAEAAGCDQFTNLDEVIKGGEGIEYYTYLRQCIKKSGAPPAGQPDSCDEFYSWEGSDESGYQLKVESLKSKIVNNNGNNEQHPATTDGSTTQCEYGLPPGATGYEANKGCREFYSRGGQVSHYIFSKTIACTDDCHPYRRTETNELTADDCRSGCSIGDAACFTLCNTNDSCSAIQLAKKSSCKQSNGNVILCKSGGIWSADNNSCLYMAVPNQGVSCSAAQKNCREYTGNTGNNIRKIFTDDFSTGTTGAWRGTVAPSNEALTLGQDNQGHSLEVKVVGGSAVAERRVGNAVGKDLDYVLNFVAKVKTGTSPAVLTAKLGNGAATSTFDTDSSLRTLKDAWQVFEINLTGLNHEASAGEVLRLEASGVFYIDSITLTEITDRYYLIKDSWRTPAVCDQTLDGVSSPLYMLGCDQYTDRAEKINNLKKFNKLCPESAVGCELMKDTQNSSNPYQAGTVPADDFTYVAYDAEKLCGASEKGCALLGQSYKYENATLYSDVYLKNDPDKYATILCSANAVGCEAFSYDNGASASGEKYFKDPGDMVCEWRRQTGAGASEDWFKKKVKRCDDGSGRVNGKIDASGNPLVPLETNVCLSDSNCSIVAGKADVKCAKDGDCGVNVCVASTKKCSINGNNCATNNDCAPLTKCVSGSCHYSCLNDNNDYKCNTDENTGSKTLGLGGRGNQVIQPNGWAGICAAADSGCTEYIDPVSKFNTNLIFNGSFQDLAGSVTDGWLPVGGSFRQEVILDARTVYRLARGGDSGSTAKLNCPGVILRILDNNNYLYLEEDPATPDANHNIVTPDDNSRLFYISATGEESYNCTVTVDVATVPGFVEIKKAAIDYQLAANLDRQSCNGQVNPGQGCVLFNERKQSGLHLAGLDWDADLVIKRNSKNPLAGAPLMNNDSNMIIKVAPDRTCDKWLTCKSYIKDADGDNVCFDIGLCDAVDQNGNCRNFLTSKQENRLANGILDFSNLSGYAKVGISGGSLINDYYPLDRMTQKGEVANMSNGSFEYYGSNLYPIGWTWGGQAGAGKSWDAGVFSVINNPISAQTEGIGRAPEGAAFLKLGSSFDAVSEKVDVIPGTEYIITAFVNTKNLKSGEAKIDILGIANGGGVIRQALGNDWKFQMGRFITGPNDSQVAVKLYASLNGVALASSEGNFYFDGIKIQPALNSRKNLVNDTDWFAPQSCRLYPQSDALSCDYYEDSGKRQKGWPGYCLEYDRSPGDPNTCLLWYPVDKVKGDGIEEGAGYADRTPLYYTIEKTKKYNCSTDMLVPVKIGSKYEVHGSCRNSDNEGCHDDDEYVILTSGVSTVIVGQSNLGRYGFSNSSSCGDQKTDFSITYNGGGNDATPVFSDGIYDYYCPDGTIPEVRVVRAQCSSRGAEYNNPLPARKKYPQYYASKIVQVVTPLGQNKYWASRVYKGSDYDYLCNTDMPDYALTSLAETSPGYISAIAEARNCSYSSDFSPFGSIVPPSSVYNPYDWDSSAQEDGNQPLYYEIDKDVARAGQIQNINSVRLLFAQSYGAWKWDATELKYVADNVEWGPPGANGEGSPNFGKCSYTVRPPNSTDYCAILPTVTKIKVNENDGLVSDVVLTNSQFVKLSFNTKADSQQLPLVMYGVDWGDGTKTLVTGAEMFDKQEGSGLEEVIYHLYSYWDLKARFNSGLMSVNSCTISAGGIGECRVRPRIQIKDNWGWCNKGVESNPQINVCTVNQWQPFTREIVVKER